MNLGTREIGEVLYRIWTEMLGLKIGPASPNQTRIETPPLVAVVEVGGTWTGSLVVFCPPALARRAGAVLLGKEPAEVSDEEARDAVGELTNVAAGNLVSVLPGRFERARPRVLDGWQPELFAGPHLVRRFAFDCEGEAIIVEVLEPYADPRAERRDGGIAGARRGNGHDTPGSTPPPRRERLN